MREQDECRWMSNDVGRRVRNERIHEAGMGVPSITIHVGCEARELAVRESNANLQNQQRVGV